MSLFTLLQCDDVAIRVMYFRFVYDVTFAYDVCTGISDAKRE